MNIINISKENKQATIELSTDELIKLCNVLYSAQDDHKNDLYHKLYSELMMTRDLCLYGHIDDFCLEHIIKELNSCKNSNISGILSDTDIAIFNSYLENNDIPTACGNSDWNKIYAKIVGNNISPKLKEWKDRIYEGE